jgi:glutamate synthase (NADPH/NADH) small chain
MDYLTRQNRVLAGDQESPELDANGKHVVILGGGDTGSDCYGTALRQGAASVTQIQLWPAPPETRPATNPWPQWPLVFRTSSSQEEGGEREFACVTKKLLGEDGRIAAIELVRIDTEEVPGARRPRAIELPETTFQKPCDLLILAIGFTGPKDDSCARKLGAATDERGIMKVGPDYMTDQPGIFAAGDAMRGASLIVWAIADGREAAHNIDSYLRQEPSRLPTRGIDSSFEDR